MQTQTFQAREMSEALALVRRELGPDAIIVETKRVSGRALGLLGGTFVEVTAAPGESESAPVSRGRPRTPTPTTTSESTSTLLAQRRATRNRQRGPQRDVSSLIAEEPSAALAAVTGVRPHAALRRRLLAALVPRELCESWLTHVPEQPATEAGRAFEENRLRAVIRGTLGDPIDVCRPSSRVAAFIGPTGVGKTTTIAKLAARATLLEDKRVAIVSNDDVRIGGTAALRAYAGVLGVPMTTSAAEGGLPRALARFADADLVLVDTAGLSPGRAPDFAELARKLARAGEPVTTHLCVAASTRNEELDRILHLYGAASPNAVLPTKLDEAVAIGTVLAARTRLRVPLSFATTGQQVPDDIAHATPDFIIDLLLGDDRA